MQVRTEADYDKLREQMVERQIRARGVESPRVLTAMRTVRREGYVPSYLGEFAYDDTPLPIEEEQTISQPYIVAFMIDALALEATDRALEVGTGSGYAAAVLGELCREVHTVERHAPLAESAAERLRRDGYAHVHVHHGDGSLGWSKAAPFDAIIVAAGGPEVPQALRSQLAVGGRLVMPVGEQVGLQELVRVTRHAEDEYETETLANVRFVPLVGAAGFRERPFRQPIAAVAPSVSLLLAECAEPFASIDEVDVGPLATRLQDARVVLIGESSHGTSEFYRMRARITRELIERHGFSIVALEADWPDAARIDHYVRDRRVPASEWTAFSRFPAWMWRNEETRAFVDWLHVHNASLPADRRVRFAGIDVYGLYNSIDAIVRLLEDKDPETARIARHRYACLSPWEHEPSSYGRAALESGMPKCEREVLDMLDDLLQRRMEWMRRNDEEMFEILQHAHAIADAEAYYRVMWLGGRSSWNLRDRHMFESLSRLLEFQGDRGKAVVWAHNSHVGDARATSMSARGEFNIGQLCREEWGEGCRLVGMGTDRGTVAAASHWGGAMEIKKVRPAHERSFERLCHDTDLPAFVLPLRRPRQKELTQRFSSELLQRAIGVVYRPETELQSHYLHAAPALQFDEYVWFDQSRAVSPLLTRELEGLPETYPFGI